MNDGKLTAARLTRLLALYFARPGNSSGGSLHILVDGNLSESSAAFCEGWATERGDWTGARLARLLRLASGTQRSKAVVQALHAQPHDPRHWRARTDPWAAPNHCTGATLPVDRR